MSIKFRSFGSKQSGDTIVEVVIAIAVIAVVLTGAFVVTNRSLTAVRDSEEHSEALNLLQGQVEQLRNGALSLKSSETGNGAKAFCFDSGGTNTLLPSASCTQNTLYSLSVQECSSSVCPPSGLTTTFLCIATWDSLNGGKDQVQLTYRVAT